MGKTQMHHFGAIVKVWKQICRFSSSCTSTATTKHIRQEEEEAVAKYLGILAQQASSYAYANAKPCLETALAKVGVQLSHSIVETVLNRCCRFDSHLDKNNNDHTRKKNLGLRFFLWSGQQPGYRHKPHLYSTACSVLGLSQNPEILPQYLLDCKNDACSITATARTFRIMLNLCKEAKAADTALKLLQQMESAYGCMPDVVMYNGVIKLLLEAGRVDTARSMLDQMLGKGIIPDELTYVTLIQGFCLANLVDDAMELLNGMKHYGCLPNVVVYTVLLNGVLKARGPENALQVLDMMLQRNCRPNVVTYTSLIQGFCQEGKLEMALQMLQLMLENGCAPNRVTCTILIRSFCMAGDFAKAYGFIDRMVSAGYFPEHRCKNLVMVSLLQTGNVREAEKLLGNMVENNVSPDGLAYMTLIKELCSSGRYLDAFNWYRLLNGMECSLAQDVCYILLQGLFTAGYVHEAASIFESLDDNGSALDGLVHDALVHYLEKTKTID